ncbi:mediator of RNA polymerase II transcription subunit 15a-like isoform X2 [Salvia miltiorrhiza]|uniref:mediator of RNA polymerase II transcription subunit 15a-like isoform X2 n=1 Tax=Salvia miltiorrhiza TaxID=226208 RepID=UPI0025ABEDD0|nr:mediator of RNA polymerase II transcription subunit 15a-like isoform X2 [Salvia miltiorrhiza]
MDSNNEQVPKPDQVIGGEAVPTGDWRTQLPQGSRERIANKITETLKRHLPFSGQEGLQELKKIAVRFEEKIYTAATSQSDYLRKISLKMLMMETKSKNPMPNSLQSNAASNSKNPQDPASQSMQSQMQSLVQQLPIPMVPNRQQILSQNIPNNIPSTGVPNSAGLTPAMPPIGGMSQGTMHQQQSTVQQNNLPNMHQQQSGGQTNLSGVLQQQMGGIQHGNSNLQTNPQAVHKLQQSKVVAQQLMQQKLATMFSNQAQAIPVTANATAVEVSDPVTARAAGKSIGFATTVEYIFLVTNGECNSC